MGIQGTSTSSAPSTPHWKYDVFLSFRGYDTRKGFTRNLYTALEHDGIRTFMDDPKLRKGEVITPALLSAIEESKLAIIVLSKNYSSSRWCLDELVRIFECMKARETVLPVFYDVDPSEVRRQTGSFGEAFIKQEERFRDDEEKLLRWRSALAEVANLSGWTSNDERYETELIRKIVGDIWKKLPPRSFGYAENLVAMDKILEPVHSLLGVGEDDVQFIGIWGMGGIGKTTMVRAVKDRISPQFECAFLLSNVRDSIEKGGLLSLQKQLLKAMIQADQIDQIFDPHEAATALRNWFSGKKVLLILDDVKDHKNLELLAGSQKWFGSGSRVLITTRDEHLLIQHRVERRVKVEVLNDDDSLQLFSQKAFKRSCPEEDFLGLSRAIINYAKGLPLALEALGSSLFGRDQRAWDSALSQLGRVSNLEILDVLKISYNDLDSDGKKIFLDIACFFNGEDRGGITDVLTSCGVSAEFQIDVLMERSLITETNGRLWMHDLLQEMGHEIVQQESKKLGKRSRLWHFEDIKYVLTKNMGTEAIEGIFMNSIESETQMEVTPESFLMMHKLRYLKIKNVNLPNGLAYLPDSLRVLDWKGYPSKSLPSCFNPQNLVKLILCHSCIKHFQIGTKPMRNLKTVNLSRSLNLFNTPTFEDMPNLEVLLLEGCISLYEVDPGIQVLDRLVVLNLKGCKNLVHFASSVRGLKSLRVLNLSGCSKLNNLSDELGHVASLEELDVSGSGIREVPSSIGRLKSLRVLNLSGCSKLNNLSDELGHVASLEELDVSGSGIREVPSSIGRLKSLRVLNLSGCSKLNNLSDELGHVASLEKLDVSGSGIREVPSSIGRLKSLRVLNLSGCSKLNNLSDELGHVASLEKLDVSGSGIREVPSSIGRLKSLRVLNLSGCSKLNNLSDELGHVASLEKLDVSGSGIREVPSSIGRLNNLKELSFAGCKAWSSKSWNMMFNPFQLLRKTSHIPTGLSLPCLSGLYSLKNLNLRDCSLSEGAIPDDFGGLASLTDLDLSNNQFVRLPESIGQLSRLEHLHLHGCRNLRRLPQFGSDVWVNASNCISLDVLDNQVGLCNSLVRGRFANCLKMVENESAQSIALRFLAYCLQSKAFFKGDILPHLVCPGNEIPEYYSHQSAGSSVSVELHPGWLSNNFIGFACCVLFRVLRPIPPLIQWTIGFLIRANGQPISYGGQPISYGGLALGGEFGSPLWDHICCWYFSHDGFSPKFQDIYYQLEFSFTISQKEGKIDEKMVQIGTCGIRLIYVDDVKELQTLMNQSSTKRSLQHYDDDDDGASSGSASQAQHVAP